MLTLYDNQVSGNCYKVRLLLHQLGTPFASVHRDVLDRSGRRPDNMGGSNLGRVPVVEFDDGRWLGESNAILWYFATGTPFLPEDRWLQAQTMQWLCFEQYELEPNLAVARYWWTLLGEREKYAAQLVEKHERGRAALLVMEEHLASRSFFVGDAYGIADIALHAYSHVALEGGVDLAPYSAVRAWIARIAAQPRHVPITHAFGA